VGRANVAEARSRAFSPFGLSHRPPQLNVPDQLPGRLQRLQPAENENADPVNRSVRSSKTISDILFSFPFSFSFSLS